jgi:hypothetical protein
MIDPGKKDIGRKVRRVDNRGSDALVEGVITGFDLHHVYVRYGNHTTSKGTRRQDLAWADEVRTRGCLANCFVFLVLFLHIAGKAPI